MSASEASIDAAMLDPAGLSEEDMAALIASADTGQEIPQDVEGATSGAGENEKGTQDEPIESADPEARAKEEGKEPKQPEAKPDATPQATDERLPVLTRDGKQVIPFEVLESTRKRASEAEQRAQAALEQAEVEKGQREVLERQFRELSERTKAAEQGEKPDADAKAANEIVSDEQLEAIKEGSEELYSIVKGLRDGLVKAEAKAEAANQRQEQSEAERLEQARAEVRTRINQTVDNNPKLVYLRETNTDAYNQIADLDRMLANSKFHQHLPLADRIGKAVSMYEEQRGVIKLPGQPTGEKQKAPAKDSDPDAKPAGGPHTLSDIPGGALPHNSEVENADELGIFQLTQKMEGLGTVDAINEYVGKLGNL